MQKRVNLIKGENGEVVSVVLSDGTEIKADLVIVGAGIAPNTEFLKDSSIELDSQGGVVCDPFLQTSEHDIYAAGDVASYPYWYSGKRIRVEHWLNAGDQGSNAAFNMLGKMVPFGRVPFFWTRHYNKAIQSAGYADTCDDIIVEGSIEELKFVAFHTKGDKVLAVSACQNGKALVALQEAMAQNVMPSASSIKSGQETVESITKKVTLNKGAAKCKRESCCHKKSTNV